MKQKGAKFRVGQRVTVTIPGTIESVHPGMLYVRVIVRGGDNKAAACCYYDEVRPLARERGKGKVRGA